MVDPCHKVLYTFMKKILIIYNMLNTIFIKISILVLKITLFFIKKNTYILNYNFILLIAFINYV